MKKITEEEAQQLSNLTNSIVTQDSDWVVLWDADMLEPEYTNGTLRTSGYWSHDDVDEEFHYRLTIRIESEKPFHQQIWVPDV